MNDKKNKKEHRHVFPNGGGQCGICGERLHTSAIDVTNNKIVVGNIQFNNKGEITNKESLKELFEGLEDKYKNPIDYRFDIENLDVTIADEELCLDKRPGFYIYGEVSVKKQVQENNCIDFKEIAKYKFKSEPGVQGLTQMYCEDEFCRYKELSIFLRLYCLGIKQEKFCWSSDVREM